MTSLEIAELTGKQHKHVMEAIRKMEPAWVNIAGSNFRLGSYKDLRGHTGIDPLCARLIISVILHSVPPTRTHCVGGFCFLFAVPLHRQQSIDGVL